jgi:flagellar biosynthesis regulator FlaF
MTFRKSSYSDADAKECVEVAGTLDALRDSKNPDDLLAVELRALLTAVKSDRITSPAVSFRKSSFSDNNGAECVEVAGTLDILRDSKNPDNLLAVELRALLTAVKSDRITHPAMSFRKSSFSDANGGACVEVAGTLDTLRDSKNPDNLLVVDLQPFLAAVTSDQLTDLR